MSQPGVSSPRPGPRRALSGTILSVVLFTMFGGAVAFRYWPSDERDVKRHLVHLSEALSVPGKETEVEHLTRVAALREYFDPQVRVTLDGRELVTSDTLIRALTAWSPPPGGFSVEFANQTIALAEDRSTAEVSLIARMASKDTATGESLIDARDVVVSMSKARGDWMITKADAREPLDRP